MTPAMVPRGVYRGRGAGDVTELRCVARDGCVVAVVQLVADGTALEFVRALERWLDILDPIVAAPPRPALTCTRGGNRPARARPRAAPVLTVVRTAGARPVNDA